MIFARVTTSTRATALGTTCMVALSNATRRTLSTSAPAPRPSTKTELDGNVKAAGWFVSSPHPVSHIRLIQYPAQPSDGPRTRAFKHEWEDVMQWHHAFWSRSNARYASELAAFEEQVAVQHDRAANDDDRAVFYRRYLDEHYAEQTHYYRAWIRRLLSLCGAGMRAAVFK
ncbi:hypothetical protein BC828DRAFT_373660 [Blastocladiella britannica]|nr:hypothetical protein BC828DRAFT_373660 [Blastocladiella britannica]